MRNIGRRINDPLADIEAELDSLVENNPQIEFCKVFQSYGLMDSDRLLLYVFCNRLVNEDDNAVGTFDWEEFIDIKYERRRIKRH